ncbi:MAG: hypothetical protein GX025_01460 [Clostridiales bacterium]|nr:hypothetical protein [Clostridiales bacterium]
MSTPLSHAYIISSADTQLREEKSLELSMGLLCEKGGSSPCMKCSQCKNALGGTNPDLITISRKTDDKGRQRRELLVDQIREMSSDSWVRPQAADKKVYIISDADTMNQAAQNAALKLLEEPAAYAVFILLVSSAAALLPTVRSRCVEINLRGEEKREENPLAREYIALAEKGDRAGLCSFCSHCEELSSQELSELLISIQIRLCDIIAFREKSSLNRASAFRLSSLCRLSQEYLRMNVGAKHILGLICVQTIETP